MRNIVLTGFMGVGKTTVGRELAKRLKMKFFDMDEIIEKEEGKTIVQIFDEKGEKYFRKKEDEIFRKLLDEDSAVISTGGGTFENADLRKLCKEKATSVCLVSSFESLIKKIEELKESRPMLRNKSIDEIKQLYKIRAECYIDCDNCVEVDNMNVNQVVEEILGLLNK